MNIQIKIIGSSIYFSKYYDEIEKENLNSTNIINDKNLIFSKKYIEKNNDIISTFINLIVLKKGINTAIIKNNELGPIVIPIIRNITNIQNIKFIENKELDYTTISYLLENNNFINIECYNLPEIMYYKFPKNTIKTRNVIIFKSDFTKYNNINTYSDLYYKDKVVIDSYLTKYDVDDIIFFFKKNKHVNKVIIRGYCKQNLISFLKIIKENSKNKIDIILLQDDSNTKNIIKDINFFNKLSKEYNVNIKIKYTKKYISNNIFKEINLKLFKYALVFILIINAFLLSGYKVYLSKSLNSIKVVNKKINEIVKNSVPNQLSQINNETTLEVDSEPVSSYYQNYNNVYSDLLNLNDNTIGWLTVNNTKINYPVVQYTDNDYYLNHAFDKSNNIIGWVFADYRNNFDILDKNTIIYAHSMVDGGLMFTTLKKVLDSEWYLNNNNLNINFSVKDKAYTWRVFSIYVIDETNDYLYTNFSSNSDFLDFIKKIKDRSIYDFNQNIDGEAHLLTLSTCYKDGDHRLVVHAFLNN